MRQVRASSEAIASRTRRASPSATFAVRAAIALAVEAWYHWRLLAQWPAPHLGLALPSRHPRLGPVLRAYTPRCASITTCRRPRPWQRHLERARLLYHALVHCVRPPRQPPPRSTRSGRLPVRPSRSERHARLLPSRPGPAADTPPLLVPPPVGARHAGCWLGWHGCLPPPV